MFSTQSKDGNSQELVSKSNYLSIYQSLEHNPGQESDPKFVELILKIASFIPRLWFLFLFGLVSLILYENQEINNASQVIIIGLLVDVFLYSATFLYRRVQYGLGKSLINLVADVKISISEKIVSPVTRKDGLTLEEVATLRKIALIHQNSADWRNGIIEVAIFGVLGILVSYYSVIENPDCSTCDGIWWRNFVFSLSQSIQNIIHAIENRDITSNALPNLTTVFFVLYILRAILKHLIFFVTSERTNRAIQIACVEYTNYQEKVFTARSYKQKVKNTNGYTSMLISTLDKYFPKKKDT